MYHSKKIGVFISHIMGHYQQNVCQGIIDKALEYGYTAEIFASMDGENLGEYGLGEDTILQIPNYDDFCGVIYASDTYVLPELKEQIYQTLREKCSCPVIEIAVANQRFPAIVLENNSTFGELTHHLITEHHAKRICYLGSRRDTFFSDQREQYYRNEMAKAGLTVSQNDVFNGDATNISAANALNFFFSDTTKIDAVICYNDTYALLLMLAAFGAGYKIPEDFAITGCDATDEGRNTTPVLTSISFPVYELGNTAVENLVKAIHQESVPAFTAVSANMILGGSCGCNMLPEKNPIFFGQTLINRINSIEGSMLSSMRMSAGFQNITDIDDGMDLLENYIQGIEHCREFYLCLYAGWDSISAHILELTESNDDSTLRADEVLLKLAIRDGKRLPECSFTKNALLPEHIDKHSNSAYIYTPLFFKNKQFGYIALSYENNQVDYHFQLVHWFMNINQMLQRICDARRTSILVNHLEDIYTKDALTGLYNKHGYLHNEALLLADALRHESIITCFIFDLNGLKHINDTYGHAEGDFAIQVIGHALSSIVRSEDVCARFSGDEFYLLAADYTKEDADELLIRVQKYLSNYNKLSHKEYTISASGGYAQSFVKKDFSSDDVKQLFSLADKNMYLQKKTVHVI